MTTKHIVIDALGASVDGSSGPSTSGHEAGEEQHDAVEDPAA